MILDHLVRCALTGAIALIAGLAVAQTRRRRRSRPADRVNTGLHILELTGEARAIAGLPPP